MGHRSAAPASYLRALRGWAAEAGEPGAEAGGPAAEAGGVDGSVRRADPLGVVVAVADEVAAAEGWPTGVVDELHSLTSAPGRGARPPLPPPELARPELLGQVYEALLAPGYRHQRGAFYTPPEVAAGLVARVLEPAFARRDPRVGDPAVGGGAFLLAACRHLHRWGSIRGGAYGGERGDRADDLGEVGEVIERDPGRLVVEEVWGADLDPAAVAITRLALGWWAWRATGGRHWPADAGRCLAVADTLVDDGAWPARPDRRPWAMVGNPPFLGQLSRATARSSDLAARLVSRLGPSARGYVDSAVLFLLAASRQGAPGDRVALIQPESMLTTAHAGPARRELLARGRLLGLWLGGPDVFGAGIRVCAPLIELGHDHLHAGPQPVPTWRGPSVEAAPPARVTRVELTRAPTWGAVVAPLRGVPGCRPSVGGTVADLASATAGFRDEFYGLAPLVAEGLGTSSTGGRPGHRSDRWAPLVTCGLIGPATCHWGRRPARVAGRTWVAPVVDLAALAGGCAPGQHLPGWAAPPGPADRAASPRLAGWVAARRRPKLVVATQSPVLAAAADPAGTWVPSVPVVAIEPADPADLWRLLAAVVSPVATAWAAERFGGAGLAGNSLKLSARQLLELPLPVDAAAWDRAAGAYRAVAVEDDPDLWRAGLLAAGRLVTAAYRLPAGEAGPLLMWWEDRLPGWPRSIGAGSGRPAGGRRPAGRQP